MTSSATLVTYLVGGSVVPIAIGMLVIIGATLTLSPVVCQALEKIEWFKVAAVLLLIVVASVFAIDVGDWAAAPQIVTNPGIPVQELGFALLMGALAFAGAGGGQNLCQSNWIRDKGFGMGSYVPKIVSPVTGHPEAAPSTGYVFEPTPENLRRWDRWWKFANVEQLSTFVLITFVTITFTSLLAYATVFGQEGLASDISFIQAEGNARNDAVGGWFGTFFWVIGAISLFAAALGIVDYTCRLAADVLKTAYVKDANESKIYAGLVWGLVAIGIVVLLSGLTQPIILRGISAVTGGLMMFIYSALLILVNKRTLPKEIQPGAGRVAAGLGLPALRRPDGAHLQPAAAAAVRRVTAAVTPACGECVRPGGGGRRGGGPRRPAAIRPAAAGHRRRRVVRVVDPDLGAVAGLLAARSCVGALAQAPIQSKTVSWSSAAGSRSCSTINATDRRASRVIR